MNPIIQLATNEWEQQEDTNFGYSTKDNLCEHFRTPPYNVQVDLSQMQEKWDDMIEYTTIYLDEDYKVISWKSFNCADAKKWSNVLALTELIFCLPMANG